MPQRGPSEFGVRTSPCAITRAVRRLIAPRAGPLTPAAHMTAGPPLNDRSVRSDSSIGRACRLRSPHQPSVLAVSWRLRQSLGIGPAGSLTRLRCPGGRVVIGDAGLRSDRSGHRSDLRLDPRFNVTPSIPKVTTEFRRRWPRADIPPLVDRSEWDIQQQSEVVRTEQLRFATMHTYIVSETFTAHIFVPR